MKTIVFTTLAFFLAINSVFSQGWQLIYNFPQYGYGIHSLYFTDGNTGYGTYWGGIVKTTNAGNNWLVPPVFSDLGHRSIFFINANTGFIAGAGLTADTGEVFKTTNAGGNWYTCNIPVKRHFTTAYFLNQNTGYVSGYGVILKTTNTGLNWEVYYLPYTSYYFAICFTSANTGYMVGNSGRIFRTTDGGGFWQLLNTGTGIHLWGIDFYDANTGVAVGGYSDNSANIILRTTDAGNNWSQIPYNYSTAVLWTIRFVNSSTGFITGVNSNILKTTNSGNNWYNQYSPSFQIGRTIFFTNSTTGYMGGLSSNDSGIILKTTDGGGPFVGVDPVSNEVPEQFSLYQNYPNPFNPVTKIVLALPKSGNVKLTVFDVLGREVAILVNENLNPGTYEVDFDGTNYPSGVYFYTLRAGDFVDAKKMVLVK